MGLWLVAKAKNIRRKQTKKQHGEARILTVEELEKVKEERQEKEDIEEAAKKRRAALRGQGALAQLVWKEMPITYDYFTCE